jgi:hypothetical protein
MLDVDPHPITRAVTPVAGSTDASVMEGYAASMSAVSVSTATSMSFVVGL